MKLQSEPFKAVENGTKTIEVRLYDRKRSLLREGDTILFTQIGTENVIEAVVTSIKRFDTFKALYDACDKTALGYFEEDVCRPEDMYTYYTKDDEAVYGVVAIGIKKLY